MAEKKYFFIGWGFSTFWEFYQKRVLTETYWLFSAKTGSFEISSIYSESAQKLYQKMSIYLIYGNFVGI
jgi:hypothetical protein